MHEFLTITDICLHVKCCQLFQLVLRENDLIALPKEIGELSRLKELHIQGNRLTILPPELGEVSHDLAVL